MKANCAARLGAATPCKEQPMELKSASAATALTLTAAIENAAGTQGAQGESKGGPQSRGGTGQGVWLAWLA